jgi:hypothetical protein
MVTYSSTAFWGKSLNLTVSTGASVSLVTSSAYKHVVEVGNRHAQKLKDAYTATLVNQTRTNHRYQIEVGIEKLTHRTGYRLNLCFLIT